MAAEARPSTRTLTVVVVALAAVLLVAVALGLLAVRNPATEPVSIPTVSAA